MKLDPTLSPSQAHQILLRQAGQTFGPARTFELNDALAHAGQALSRIARAPLPLTGYPPDQSGVDDWAPAEINQPGRSRDGEFTGQEAGKA